MHIHSPTYLVLGFFGTFYTRICGLFGINSDQVQAVGLSLAVSQHAMAEALGIEIAQNGSYLAVSMDLGVLLMGVFAIRALLIIL